MKTMMKTNLNARGALVRALALTVGLMPTTPALADPCGMVPPIWIGDGNPIERVGLQRTYVFHKNGIETLVLRPGFDGQVDEFGMLIPFPSPPSIRKVADDVFSHVAASIDPPEVLVDLRWNFACDMELAVPAGRSLNALGYQGHEVREKEVVVLRREAVGMYEVAVLEAGSAAALQVWMDEHGFRYPEGMDATCDEYVEDGWCFVAVKARVGKHAGSQAQPGMRSVDLDLPEGAGFDGHVQAMGFRFRTDELVVPMRLSAFNPGELHNVVYVLADGPVRIDNLPAGYVKRQIPGWQLYRNLTNPLPLRVLGGGMDDVPEWRRQTLAQERDPLPHNGIARELFAADLLAARTGRLAHELEEREKELLEIGERLGLRGPALDQLHDLALADEREALVEAALADLEGMTMTVIDADFPREVLAAENLTFSEYGMSSLRNSRRRYDANLNGPGELLGGTLLPFGLGEGLPPGGSGPLFLGAAFALAAVAVAIRRREQGAGASRTASSQVALAAFLGLALMAPHAESTASQPADEDLATALGEGPLAQRGWAVLALLEDGRDAALERVSWESDSALVRTWAVAARTAGAGPEALVPLGERAHELPAVVRPVRLRWQALLADPDHPVELATVLAALSRSPALQQELLPLLLDRPSGVFAELCIRGEGDQVRNLAAGILARLAADGRGDVPAALFEALRFDSDLRAGQVPWSGGALFLPGLAWDKDTGSALMRELVTWHLWCDQRGLEQEQRQIDRNLNSWNLANALGFDMPGGQVSSSRWLDVYGQVAGRPALIELLRGVGTGWVVEPPPEARTR